MPRPKLRVITNLNPTESTVNMRWSEYLELPALPPDRSVWDIHTTYREPNLAALPMIYLNMGGPVSWEEHQSVTLVRFQCFHGSSPFQSRAEQRILATYAEDLDTLLEEFEQDEFPEPRTFIEDDSGNIRFQDDFFATYPDPFSPNPKGYTPWTP